jgi:hypothetical protein
MGQVATSRYGERQFIGAWVNQEQRELVAELARQEDRSVSSVIRRALERELQRAAKLEGAASAPLRVVPSEKSEGERHE